MRHKIHCRGASRSGRFQIILPHRSFGSQPAAISLRFSSPQEPRTSSTVWRPSTGVGPSAGLSHLSHPSEGEASDIFSGGSLGSALRPPALDALGLMAALRSQAAQVGNDSLRITVVHST